MVTGCTPNSPDGPSTPSTASVPSASVIDPSSISSNVAVNSATESATPSVIDVATPSSAPTATLDPEAQEIADRAAVEAAWANFWTVSDSLADAAENDRNLIAATISIDPTLTQILEQARQFSADGLAFYGAPALHPYWEQSIGGGVTAVMGDCTDTSQSGTIETSTGKKRTVGVPDDNTRATFTKGADGVWRVREIFYLLDVPC